MTETKSVYSLKEIYLSRNPSIIGTLATTIGYLISIEISSRLEEFNVGKNDLVGIVPTQTGNLAPPLHTWAIGKNDFSGTIPTEFGMLTLLREVDFHSNNYDRPQMVFMGYRGRICITKMVE